MKKNSKLYSALTNKNTAKKNERAFNVEMTYDPVVSAERNMLSLLRVSSYGNEIIDGTYKPFDTINTDWLKRKIIEYNSTDLSRLSDYDLKQILFEIVSEIILEPAEFKASTELYRVRDCNYAGESHGFYSDEKEVWCAPPKFINRGRLNEKGEQILYTSFDALAPIHEIRCQIDQTFALMKYTVRQNCDLKTVFIASSRFRDIIMPENFTWTQRGRNNWQIINEFVNTEFTKKNLFDEENNYRSTIILSKLYSFPGCEGFFYPSVAKDESFNLAIKPISVHKLQLSGLSYCRYKGLSDDPERIGREYDLRMYRLWATGIQNKRIEYRPVSNCEIKFNGLFEPSETVFYDV